MYDSLTKISARLNINSSYAFERQWKRMWFTLALHKLRVRWSNGTWKQETWDCLTLKRKSWFKKCFQTSHETSKRINIWLTSSPFQIHVHMLITFCSLFYLHREQYKTAIYCFKTAIHFFRCKNFWFFSQWRNKWEKNEKNRKIEEYAEACKKKWKWRKKVKKSPRKIYWKK